jgi:uncharacterized YigZ family protein
MTIAAPSQVELPRIKGSRFTAEARRARSVEDAKAFIGAVRSEHPGATHTAWALRLSCGTARSDDDGEVRGTAGPPILQRICGAGLMQVAVTVTRYYGGTKLGRGGLIRAYGEAAAAALDAAQLIEQIEQRTLTVCCAYRLLGPLQGTILQHGATITDTTYDEQITLSVTVPVELADALCAALQDRSAGQATIR